MEVLGLLFLVWVALAGVVGWVAGQGTGAPVRGSSWRSPSARWWG